MLRVDVRRAAGRPRIEASLRERRRRDRPVRPVRRRQDIDRQYGRRPAAARPRPIEIDGEVLDDTAQRVHVPADRRRIGYVFQDARLFPHLSVGRI